MIHRMSSVPHDRDNKHSFMTKLWAEDTRFMEAAMKIVLQDKLQDRLPHLKVIDDVTPFQLQKLFMENGECARHTSRHL
jgi:hypothetical protein